VASKRVQNAKSDKFHSNIHKRGKVETEKVLRKNFYDSIALPLAAAEPAPILTILSCLPWNTRPFNVKQ
jgi:Ribosome associated membrane protein RAMP4